MNFAPTDSSNEKMHRRVLAMAANAALRGETHNTGSFRVPAGAAQYVLEDPRLNVDRVVALTALDSVAADLRPWIAPADLGKGRAVIRFSRPADADCGFDYIITGTKRLESV